MIYIDPDLCKGCLLCVNTCNAHVFTVAKKANKKGVFLPIPTNENDCLNCGECELLCPDQAILVNIEKNWWLKDNKYAFNPNFSKIKS